MLLGTSTVAVLVLFFGNVYFAPLPSAMLSNLIPIAVLTRKRVMT